MTAAPVTSQSPQSHVGENMHTILEYGAIYVYDHYFLQANYRSGYNTVRNIKTVQTLRHVANGEVGCVHLLPTT